MSWSSSPGRWVTTSPRPGLLPPPGRRSVIPSGRILSPREEALIGGDLFPSAYRQQIGANLIRLDAVLADLARYTDDSTAVGAGRNEPAWYTCVALDSGARSARAEVLTALVVQWLTVQVTSSSAVPAVIVAGADEITRAPLEHLSDACERRGIPLTLLFGHLRDDGLALLGGGTAGFMRLGNHAEAEQAPNFIGRQRTFVLSQLTATIGGNETHTRTETEGTASPVPAVSPPPLGGRKAGTAAGPRSQPIAEHFRIP